MVKFKLVSDYVPKGDQPEAIRQLVEGIKKGKRFQTLLGATGTGKTYTMANVIEQVNMPTLVMAPNKLLAAQLYQEFKSFFPENAVHYYISYFDYYQPEAYIPQTGMYIEKDSDVNEEIMKYRLASTHALMTRQDVIVVASVSAIYGIGNPEEWSRKSFVIEPGQEISRLELMKKLISIQYERNDVDFRQGRIRVRGDTVDIFPGYYDNYYRVSFFGDEIESIWEIEAISDHRIQEMPNLKIFPTREYVAVEDMIEEIIKKVYEELEECVAEFKAEEKWAEAQRLEERVNYEMEMFRETGFFKGIENYSRYLDQRKPGEPPACIIDYFPEDFLLIMDESHIGVPQIRGMIHGDQARKRNLVKYGFRLPSALDNRPLTFEEWESKIKYAIFTSATPGPYELKVCSNQWVDQVIRPTGLIDPEVEIRPVANQIDDLLSEIHKEIGKGNRVLVTTLTKRMAESIAEYYSDVGIKIEYLHSDIDTVERMEIIRRLRQGIFDVLIGINLLREGLDIPEVGLVAILDGDKEGFLRDTRSLIQTIGRASRNVNGRAIIYADKETRSIKAAIRETNRRREKQIKYNKEHNITPQTIKKDVRDSLAEQQDLPKSKNQGFRKVLEETLKNNQEEDEILKFLQNEMQIAAEKLEFEKAAALRDIIYEVKSGVSSVEILKKYSRKIEKVDQMENNPHETDFTSNIDNIKNEDEFYFYDSEGNPQVFRQVQFLGTPRRKKKHKFNNRKKSNKKKTVNIEKKDKNTRKKTITIKKSSKKKKKTNKSLKKKKTIKKSSKSK